MTRADKIFLLLLMLMCLLAQLAHGQVIPAGTLEAKVYQLNTDQFINRSIYGVPGTVIKGTGRLYPQNTSNLPALDVKGITFDGVRVIPDLSNTPAMNPNIRIVGNTWINGADINWNNGLVNSAVTDNTVEGEARGGYWIFGLSCNGLVIANNKLTNVRSGIHVDARKPSDRLLVEQNVVDGYCGIAFEFQTNHDNLINQDNYALRPNAKYGPIHVGAFSVINDQGNRSTNQRNYVEGSKVGGDQQIPRYAFEIGGDASVSTDNFVDGAWDAFIDNDRVGTHSTRVEFNRVANIGKVPPISATSAANNGPGVVLTWNPNREKPGPFKRLGSTPPTTTPAPPTTSLSDYNAMKSDRDRLRTRLDSISVEAAKP